MMLEKCDMCGTEIIKEQLDSLAEWVLDKKNFKKELESWINEHILDSTSEFIAGIEKIKEKYVKKAYEKMNKKYKEPTSSQPYEKI